MRPTVHDIAKVAGVSLATVDRVLNARPGVREATIRRVHQAIDSLGYVRDVAAANLARGRTYALVFVIPEGQNAFLETIRAEIADAGVRSSVERASIRLITVPSFDANAYARTLAGLENIDGVALIAPETPQVRDAINRLKQRGVAVVALVSDLPGSARDHFIGINNIAAGKTAGRLMGRFLGPAAGPILVLAGSMLARDHVERRLGFDAVMARDFPSLRVLPSIEGRDDAEIVLRLLPPVLDAHPDLCGIYSLGAGNRGLIHLLEQRGLAHKVTVVAHELTPLAREALLSGTFDAVITQDVGHIIRSAVRVLRAKSDAMAINLAQERIRIDICLAENLL